MWNMLARSSGSLTQLAIASMAVQSDCDSFSVQVATHSNITPKVSIFAEENNDLSGGMKPW